MGGHKVQKGYIQVELQSTPVLIHRLVAESCEACIIRKKIHCGYPSATYERDCPAPFNWSEFNGEQVLDEQTSKLMDLK